MGGGASKRRAEEEADIRRRLQEVEEEPPSPPVGGWLTCTDAPHGSLLLHNAVADLLSVIAPGLCALTTACRPKAEESSGRQ